MSMDFVEEAARAIVPPMEMTPASARLLAEKLREVGEMVGGSTQQRLIAQAKEIEGRQEERPPK